MIQLYTRQFFLMWLFLFCIVLLNPVYGVSGSHKAETLKKSEYQGISKDGKSIVIQNKITQINDRIRYLRDELEWLNLKITHLRNFSRNVPARLEKSKEFKKSRIKSLSAEKTSYEKKLKELGEVYFQKYQQEDRSTKILKQNLDIRKSDISKKVTGIEKSKLLRNIKQKNLENWVQVTEAGPALQLNTTLPILFSSGSAKISGEYKGFFKRFADFLKPYDVKITVHGYTDPLPINTEKYPTNFELGAARAANVVHALVKNGLKPSIFRIGSTAEHRFQAKGRSEIKAIERKAEVTVIFVS